MSSDQTPTFDPEAVRAVGACLQQVCSETELSPEGNKLLRSLLSTGAQSAELDSVQQSIIKKALNDSMLAKHILDCEELLGKSTYVSADDCEDPDDEPKEPKEDKQSFFNTIVASFKAILKKIKDTANETIEWMYEKLKKHFSTTKKIVHKIVELVGRAIYWILTSLLDPTGKLRKTLEDPKASKISKVLAISALIAEIIVLTLITAYGRVAISYASSFISSRKEFLLQAVNKNALLATLAEHKSLLLEVFNTNATNTISMHVLITVALSYSRNLIKHRGA
eukprot:g8816.t1